MCNKPSAELPELEERANRVMPSAGPRAAARLQVGEGRIKFILFEYLASLGLSLERIHESLKNPRESLVNPRESEFMESLTHIDPPAHLPESSENDQFKVRPSLYDPV